MSLGVGATKRDGMDGLESRRPFDVHRETCGRRIGGFGGCGDRCEL